MKFIINFLHCLFLSVCKSSEAIVVVVAVGDSIHIILIFFSSSAVVAPLFDYN